MNDKIITTIIIISVLFVSYIIGLLVVGGMKYIDDMNPVNVTEIKVKDVTMGLELDYVISDNGQRYSVLNDTIVKMAFNNMYNNNTILWIKYKNRNGYLEIIDARVISND
jgi:hypothetical protein